MVNGCGGPAGLEPTPVQEGWPFLGLDISERVDEAIARGGLCPAGEQVVEAFLGLSDSPGYCANMINPDVTSIGVGIVLNVSRVYIPQNFAAF